MDILSRRNLTTILLLCSALFVLNQPVFAQVQDSTRIRKLPEGHTPSRVLTRALLVPGWGQIYNRQYWKAAVYYGGLGAGTYLVLSANENYLLYRHASIYAQYRDTPAEERPDAYRDSFVDDYNEILLDRLGFTESELSESDQASQRQSLAPQLRRFRDQFRRRRDLNIVFTFAIWGLGVIESFVSAHLLHFDVSDDLTLQFIPIQPGASATLTLSF